MLAKAGFDFELITLHTTVIDRDFSIGRRLRSMASKVALSLNKSLLIATDFVVGFIHILTSIILLLEHTISWWVTIPLTFNFYCPGHFPCASISFPSSSSIQHSATCSTKTIKMKILTSIWGLPWSARLFSIVTAQLLRPHLHFRTLVKKDAINHSVQTTRWRHRIQFVERLSRVHNLKQIGIKNSIRNHRSLQTITRQRKIIVRLSFRTKKVLLRLRP